MEDPFKKRERAFEAVYAVQTEQAFRARARGARLFGAWAAAKLGVKGEAARRYIRRIAGSAAAEDGDSRALGLVAADLAAAGRMHAYGDAPAMYRRCGERAKAQLSRT